MNRIDQLLGEIKLVSISYQHLEDVAKLHYKLLPWSFNGQFGEHHILKLYELLIQSPNFFGYAYYENDRLLGFVTATTNNNEVRDRITDIYRNKIFKMVRVFLRNPSFLLAAFESKFLVPRFFKLYNTRAEWLTLLSDTNTGWIGSLVTLRLIDSIREHFLSMGIDCFLAQGFKKNPPAMKLYEKLGWRVVASLPMHNIYYYSTGNHSKED